MSEKWQQWAVYGIYMYIHELCTPHINAAAAAAAACVHQFTPFRERMCSLQTHTHTHTDWHVSAKSCHQPSDLFRTYVYIYISDGAAIRNECAAHKWIHSHMRPKSRHQNACTRVESRIHARVPLKCRSVTFGFTRQARALAYTIQYYYYTTIP